jgi:uncharacterized membrane protein YhaH (DUF805 family)
MYRVPVVIDIQSTTEDSHAMTTSESMKFGEAIKSCFNKYADFNGCASRPEFWWWVLFAFIATAVFGSISPRLSSAFSLVTLLPGIAVTSRRLHDTDRSGWLQLLWLIPIVGWILLIIWCAEPGKSNRYGGSGPQAPNS